MKRVFLGPWFHWLLLLLVVGLGWLAGRARLHVTDFNLYTLAVIAGCIVVLYAVLATSRPGRSVTRDPLIDDQE